MAVGAATPPGPQRSRLARHRPQQSLSASDPARAAHDAAAQHQRVHRACPAAQPVHQRLRWLFHRWGAAHTGAPAHLAQPADDRARERHGGYHRHHAHSVCERGRAERPGHPSGVARGHHGAPRRGGRRLPDCGHGGNRRVDPADRDQRCWRGAHRATTRPQDGSESCFSPSRCPAGRSPIACARARRWCAARRSISQISRSSRNTSCSICARACSSWTPHDRIRLINESAALMLGDHAGLSGRFARRSLAAPALSADDVAPEPRRGHRRTFRPWSPPMGAESCARTLRRSAASLPRRY